MSDRAGVVGVGMQFAVWEPTRPKTEVSLDVLRDAVFAPLLRAAVAILLDDEFYGRVMFELRVAGLDQASSSFTTARAGRPESVPHGRGSDPAGRHR